jgi:hypothetical protein
VHLITIQGIVDASSSGTGSISMLGTGGATSTVTAAPATDSSGNPLPVGPIKVPMVPSNLGTVSLTVDVSGNYNAVQGFLRELYSSLRIITVQQTVMSTGKSGAQTGGSGATSANAPTTVDLKSQMQTYYTK